MYYNNLKYKKEDIFSCSETKLYKKNQVIYKEKEEINNVFIILDGMVESSTTEIPKNSFILPKGSSLGFIDIILGRPFSRNMTAKSIVSLAIIKRIEIENILSLNAFSAALIKSLVIDIDNKYPRNWS